MSNAVQDNFELENALITMGSTSSWQFRHASFGCILLALMLRICFRWRLDGIDSMDVNEVFCFTDMIALSV